jgi:ribosomal protein L18E
MTAEELEKEIWKRYGNFELSHEKNESIVKNILEFVLKQREDYHKKKMKKINKQHQKDLSETYETGREDGFYSSSL